MRKLFWFMMMTLDGMMEGPDHDIDWHVTDDDFTRYVTETGKTIDTIVFGRRTYELMAGYWPNSTDPEAPMMNDTEKVVFSRTLDRVDWKNTRLATGGVEAEIRALKEAPGRDIALLGSANLASTLLKDGLIDEVRIMLNPVVLGAGTPMFKDANRMAMKLEKALPFASGNVLLYYTPAA